AERSAMRRALDLAWRGWGRVAPNPLVGAVILQGDTVVGEGFHAEYGGPHAEVAALAAAGARARGATLIVTLEPCAHYGKTPPCTDAIVAAGVARVVAAIRDTDPEARGGADALRAQGLAASSGGARRVRPAGDAERDRQPREHGPHGADLGHGVARRPGGERHAAGGQRSARLATDLARRRPAHAARGRDPLPAVRGGRGVGRETARGGAGRSAVLDPGPRLAGRGRRTGVSGRGRGATARSASG